MNPALFLHPADLRGLARLATDGVAGTSRLVEQMHQTIASGSAPVGPALAGRTSGITGLVYRSVRGVTGLVGTTLDTVAGGVAGLLPAPSSSFARDQWLAALNGVLGDHLAATNNPLAIPMSFRHRGEALALEGEALARTFEAPRSRLLISVHGLCMNDRHWACTDGRPGLPQRLADARGLSVVDLRYNSGRAIAENGEAFAEQLEMLVDRWPLSVTEIVFLGHSMGGLVTRSALEHGRTAGHGWVQKVSSIAFLGTPHHGSPVERAGHRLERLLGFSPYSAPFNRLGGIRSTGIIDLRHGLPATHGRLDALRCLAVAATARPGLARALRGSGDGLVPIDSALGRHEDPARALPITETDRHVVPEAGHFGLLHSPAVYRILRRWLAAS